MKLAEKNQIKKILEKAKKDKRILAVALFGSCARKEYYRDIDVCVFLDKKHTSKEMFDIRLNFLRGINDKFDIQVFQQLPLYIRARILKEGKILFCKNEDLLYETAFDTIKAFDDFKEGYREYVKNAIK